MTELAYAHERTEGELAQAMSDWEAAVSALEAWGKNA
jgi:hypothetical protein